jgi:hypothetical protein
MRQAGQNTSIEGGEHVPGLHPNREGDAKLEINVIFTTYHGSLAALRTAANLARNLDARIRFLVPLVVPFALPLRNPPVSVAFTERRCFAMAQACAGVSEVRVEVTLCRDKEALLLRTLRARSVVLLGGRKSWWPSGEQKLARMLQLHGYRVVLVDQRTMSGSGTAREKIL